MNIVEHHATILGRVRTLMSLQLSPQAQAAIEVLLAVVLSDPSLERQGKVLAALAEVAASPAKEAFEATLAILRELTPPPTRQGVFKKQRKAVLGKMPITELDLRVRTENTLRNGKIETVLQLAEMPEDEFLRLKHVGRGVLAEVQRKLAPLGVQVGSLKKK